MTTGSAAARRAYDGPAFLSHGFRPFFLLAGATAALAIPTWLGIYLAGHDLPTAFAPADWHAHEMIFGYLGAVLTGFLLTAIPNWTGRLPVSGTPLAVLAGLWLAGRMAVALSGLIGPWASIIDIAFLVAVAGIAWREVLAGRNIRNLPICLLVTLFALANVGVHWDAGTLPVAEAPAWDGLPVRLALAVAALLIGLVGGRIVPSFTRNWLARRQTVNLPTPFGPFDKASLAVLAVGLIGWIGWPDATATAVLLIVAGLLHLARLSRWRGWLTSGEPLVLVLHASYLWLPVAVLLLGLETLFADRFSGSAGIHALTAGAIGVMTLAVMTRATLGHTGRPLTANRVTVAIYALVNVGAVLRVLATLTSFDDPALTAAAGLFWAAGFVLFLVGYGQMLIFRRQTDD